MIREATRPCSLCGIEYPASSFQPNRRQCRPCRQAYYRRWYAGERVSSEEYSETMRRAHEWRTREREPEPCPVDLEGMDGDAAVAYAVERYGKSGSSPSDVADAMVEDFVERVRVLQRVGDVLREKQAEELR